MSQINPINKDLNECLELIFEHGDFLPDDFYLNIMNLIKQYYENGNNFQEIHEYLDKNLNRIDKNLIKQIKGYITVKKITIKKVDSPDLCYIIFKLGCYFILFSLPVSAVLFCIINSYAKNH